MGSSFGSGDKQACSKMEAIHQTSGVDALNLSRRIDVGNTETLSHAAYGYNLTWHTKQVA